MKRELIEVNFITRKDNSLKKVSESVNFKFFVADFDFVKRMSLFGSSMRFSLNYLCETQKQFT